MSATNGFNAFETNRGVSRRTFLGTSFKTLAALAVAPVAINELSQSASAAPVSPASNGYYRTTAALNLRSGPGKNYSVLKVMPVNAAVIGVGPNQNGFAKVSHMGTVGWAAAEFLTVSNGGSSDTPQSLGTGWTTAKVNLRSGPGTGYQVLKVLGHATAVTLYNNFENNFQLVSHQGTYGWVFLDYLTKESEAPPTYLVATAPLKLRAQPNSTASVLAVIPEGGQVRAGDQMNGRYLAVTWNGISGWAHADYLN